MKRRDFLRASAVAAAAAAVPSLGGAAAGKTPEPVLLGHVLRPQDLATPLEWFDRPITPTDVFFVRSHFGAPALDPHRTLRIDGTQGLILALPDLAGFEKVTLTAVLQCAGNGRALQRPRVPGVQWVHGAMGQATWTGVRLADLLRRAGIPPGAAHVELAGWDEPPMPTVPRFLRSIPLERALDPTTLVAWAMNGAPLTLAHGAPFRLVVPGWAGDHWMKWLRSVRVVEQEARGFYMETAYRMPVQPVAPGATVPAADMRPLTVFPVKSVVARPGEGARLRAGAIELAGVAFSGAAPIARVEVTLDGGQTWARAALDGPAGAGRWQVWRHRIAAKPGIWRVAVRATDAAGSTQPRDAVWNPSGYFWNGWHAVSFEVAS